MSEAGEVPRGPRVLILGLPYFGTILERELRHRGWRARFVPHPGRSAAGWARLGGQLLRSDLLYLVGSRADRASGQARLLRWWRRPCVIHWVGTDVVFATDAHARGDLSSDVARKATHWCDAPWLVEELAEIGIASEYVSLPVVGLAEEAPPLPAEFRVLLYLPRDPIDRAGFDAETILALPTAIPGVPFTLVPSPPETLPQPLPANLTALPWVEDLDGVYRETTVYVRLPHHDGTSHMAVEALSRGRYVIWSAPFEGAIRASGQDEVVAALRGLLDLHARGELGLNTAGIARVKTAFDPAVAIGEVDRRLRALLRARR